MNLHMIITIIVAVAVAALVLFIFYRISRKNMVKRNEQQKAIDNMAQQYNMLVIDKKRLKIKQSGLPQQIIDESPWYTKFAKLPIVKAKIGPKIVVLISEASLFDQIPLKKEIKATISGIYITDIKGIRGPLDKPPAKKRGLFARLTGQR